MGGDCLESFDSRSVPATESFHDKRLKEKPGVSAVDGVFGQTTRATSKEKFAGCSFYVYTGLRQSERGEMTSANKAQLQALIRNIFHVNLCKIFMEILSNYGRNSRNSNVAARDRIRGQRAMCGICFPRKFLD